MKWRTLSLCAVGAMILAGSLYSQESRATPVATMKQMMLDLIHPASNDIQFAISRAPKDDKEWSVVRRSAIQLASSGPLLMQRSPANAAEWQRDVQLLVEAGGAAYKAAQAKDAAALSQVGPALDASCTNCHKQYRPNVFPKEGASK